MVPTACFLGIQQTSCCLLFMLVGAIQLCLAPPVDAQDYEPPALEIVFSDTGYMPFYSGDSQLGSTDYCGKGLLVDVLDQFEKEYPQFPITRTVLPTPRANLQLNQGEVGGYALSSPLFITAEQEAYYNLSEPLWRTGDQIYTCKENTFQCASIDDLHGKTLGVISGFGYGPLDAPIANHDIQTVSVRTDEQLYGVLLEGRVDAIVANRHVLSYSMKSLGLRSHELQTICPPLYEFDLSLLINKNRPDILEALNTFIQTIQDNGTLHEIGHSLLGRGCSLHHP